ncbi:MAG: glycerate kinase, partial [Firmicutes bacterium]|nr:glycerate kinase [Bacillota bacterium]
MRVLIAMDSLKGCLSSPAAGTALKTGILRAMPEADVRVCPLADGGEGTTEALTYGLGGDLQEVTVTGPLGTSVRARYGILPDGVTAVMEMSAAAGITRVPEAQRDPMKTTTFGVGEMILNALKKGGRTFLIGIGGSATNDGGAGMLQALGFDLTDG